MKLEELTRRSVLVRSGIPRAALDRFEREHPEHFSKINPLTRNSPMLVNEKAFRKWWDSCRTASMTIRKGGVM